MLIKLLRKGSGRYQIIGAAFGALTGFVLLLLSLQLYYDINEIFKSNEDLISKEYIIINKKVSLLKTLDVTDSKFSSQEIKKIKNNQFIGDVVPFISSAFKVTAYTKPGDHSSKFPPFYTELFFESVPGKYLDLKNEEWKWQPGEKLIPIVVPKEYLNLYNFGFAQSQGLPQISGKVIGLVNFRIRIKGRGRTDNFNGKIVGFSDRINSVLVPYSFLNWANTNFANSEVKTSRLIIIPKKPGDPELLKFLTENNYETNKEKLKNSKLTAVLKMALTATSIIAVIIIFLSFMVFVVAFQLIITKSREKLRILVNIGYNYLHLSKLYIIYFSLIIFVINIFAFVGLNYLRTWVYDFLYKYGFEIATGINLFTILTATILSILLIIINSLSIIYQIKTVNK